MGKLRTDSTEKFPVESRSGGISYILISEHGLTKEETVRDENGDVVYEDEEAFEFKKREFTVPYEHYKATKGEKEKLLDRLESLDGYDGVELLGIWTGKHRTDTHVLELPRFVERLQDAEL